jgi:hypothetical protein
VTAYITNQAGQDGPEQYLVTVELHMGDIVNLRTARKQAKRRLAEQEATQNRLVHGRSKAEKALQRTRSEKACADLDRHQVERKP